MLTEDTRILSQRRRTLLLMHCRRHDLHVLLGSPYSLGPVGKCPGRCCWLSGFASQAGTLSLGNSFHSLQGAASKHCLTFVPEGDVLLIFLDSKEMCPLPQRKTLSLSSKAIQISLKRWSRTETDKRHAEMQETVFPWLFPVVLKFTLLWVPLAHSLYPASFLILSLSDPDAQHHPDLS